MRKLIALILGCVISAYLCKYWGTVSSNINPTLAYILMVYVVAMGVIHLGGISLKILAALFVFIEPIADKYCYWYENTKFYAWLHRNDKHKY